jgi:hypothetical protein
MLLFDIVSVPINTNYQRPKTENTKRKREA